MCATVFFDGSVMAMAMNLYSAFFIYIFKCALQANRPMGEIRHQHVQVPLATAITP